MSLSVIDKYVAKKEKDLLDYAKILENIITIDNNGMWKNKKEFSTYAKEIIHFYAKEYYFTNNKNRNNPIEYSNDNINNVLKAIILFCKKQKKETLLRIWKNEMFLMSVIICSACYVDFATNVVDGNITDTKKKFKYLLKYLKKTKILSISDNKYWVKDLFELIRRNTDEDKKMFESIKSNNYENKYITIANSPKYYKIEFSYKIPNLEIYEKSLVAEAIKNYKVKLFNISNELLIFQILNDLISNKDKEIYLININNYSKKMKYLEDKYFKEYVKFVIPFDEMINYQDIIKELTDKNIQIVYDYNQIEHVDSKIFKNNINVLINKEFLTNNLDNKYEFEKNNIKFIIKSKEEI